MKNEQFKISRPILLAIGIITGFVFITSFTAFYTKENFSSVCGCKLPIWVIVIALASLGLFVGIFTYYILSINYLKDKKEIEKSIKKTLDFLNHDEKTIIKILIENSGKAYQSKLQKISGLNKVKISRVIHNLEEKQVIKKEKTGMTNLISLEESLIKIFI